MSGANNLSNPAFAMVQPMAEDLINWILQMDAESVTRLKSLTGKLIKVEIQGLPYFFLSPGKGRLQLLWETEHQSDATILIVLPAVIWAMSSSCDQEFRPKGSYEIIGDSDTSRLVMTFLSNFLPDWEEQISGIVGDTLARKVVQLIQMISGWAQDSGNSVARNVAEYLQQEQRVLATRPRLERFLTDVQHLQQETFGLELRLQAFDHQTGEN